MVDLIKWDNNEDMEGKNEFKKIKVFHSFYKLFFYLLDDIVLDVSENIAWNIGKWFVNLNWRKFQSCRRYDWNEAYDYFVSAAHSLQCVRGTLKTDPVHLIVI